MYQRIQCTNNYFFKIKFVFFLYLLSSVSWNENDISWYISIIRQTVGYRTPTFTLSFSWCLHITITYNLQHLRLWYYVDVVTVIAYSPEVVCLTFHTSRHKKDGTYSELTWFETTVLIFCIQEYHSKKMKVDTYCIYAMYVLSELTMIKPLSTIFVVILQNCPIRTKYLFDTVF